MKGQFLVRRLIGMFFGVALMSFGVSVFVYSALGADPFTTMNLGISSRIGLSFGTWQAILNVLILIVILFLDRSMIGLGTFANMFLIGFGADLLGNLYGMLLPATEELSFWVRLPIMMLGVACQLLGFSFYATSNLGVAPYDCLSFIVPNKTKIPFRWWRISIDAFCVVVGFLCGATVGVGTLLFVAVTGPLLPLCNKYIAAPILKIDKIEKSV